MKSYVHKHNLSSILLAATTSAYFTSAYIITWANLHQFTFDLAFLAPNFNFCRVCVKYDSVPTIFIFKNSIPISRVR